MYFRPLLVIITVPVSEAGSCPPQSQRTPMSDSATTSCSPQSVSSSPMDYARATASPPVSPPRNQKSHDTDVSNRPRVIVIGNSHLTAVDAKHLVPQADITMLKAFTIDEAAYCLDHLPFIPDCIVMHEITNDISHGYSPDICANYLLSVVDFFAVRHPQVKFIISLGLPRLDNLHLNTMTEITNALLKGGMHLTPINVSSCDHSNFLKNGSPLQHLLDSTDRYHLSHEGTKVFSSNLRCKIEIVLNLRAKYRKGHHSR